MTSGQESEDCCDALSAAERMQALSFETLQVPLEVSDIRVVVPGAAAALPSHSTRADACRLHDLGRYTLFSSFLL